MYYYKNDYYKIVIICYKNNIFENIISGIMRTTIFLGNTELLKVYIINHDLF